MRVYGRNVAREILGGDNIRRVYLAKNFNDKDILEKARNYQVKYLDRNLLDKMEKGKHQGIIIELEEYSYSSLDEVEKEDKIVMLDHIEDPHNFGAIIRTVEAAGFKSIIIPKDRSVLVTPTVVKTSVGTVKNVKIAKVSNLVTTMSELKDKGYWIVGTDMKGDNYKKIDYSGKIVIVIGNEGKGMSRLVRDNCDFIASIPMKGRVNSLNASVAAALVIFEAMGK